MSETENEAPEKEWPERLTIIRYEDGGFSATIATPPDRAEFARVYVPQAKSGQSPHEYQDGFRNKSQKSSTNLNHLPAPLVRENRTHGNQYLARAMRRHGAGAENARTRYVPPTEGP